MRLSSCSSFLTSHFHLHFLWNMLNLFIFHNHISYLHKASLKISSCISGTSSMLEMSTFLRGIYLKANYIWPCFTSWYYLIISSVHFHFQIPIFLDYTQLFSWKKAGNKTINNLWLNWITDTIMCYHTLWNSWCYWPPVMMHSCFYVAIYCLKCYWETCTLCSYLLNILSWLSLNPVGWKWYYFTKTSWLKCFHILTVQEDYLIWWPVGFL